MKCLPLLNGIEEKKKHGFFVSQYQYQYDNALHQACSRDGLLKIRSGSHQFDGRVHVITSEIFSQEGF